MIRQMSSSRADQLPLDEVVEDMSQSRRQPRCRRPLRHRAGVKGLKRFCSERETQVAPFSQASVNMMIVAADAAVPAAAAAAYNSHGT